MNNNTTIIIMIIINLYLPRKTIIVLVAIDS